VARIRGRVNPCVIMALAVMGWGWGWGCAEPSTVHTDYDPGAVRTIQGYHTFAWLPRPAAYGEISLIVSGRIRTAVTEILTAKGYAEAPADVADFRLAWHVTTHELSDYLVINRAYGYGYAGWGAGGFGSDTAPPGTAYWPLAAMVVDVVDAASNRLVWRGSALGETAIDPDPNRRQHEIEDRVREMFAEFPPPRRGRVTSDK
jgi:Domain of unknown function (DUF4136)